MSEYTQGVCCDGAAILKDGVAMTIEEILSDLRKSTGCDELTGALREVTDELEQWNLTEGDPDTATIIKRGRAVLR